MILKILNCIDELEPPVRLAALRSAEGRRMLPADTDVTAEGVGFDLRTAGVAVELCGRERRTVAYEGPDEPMVAEGEPDALARLLEAAGYRVRRTGIGGRDG